MPAPTDIPTDLPDFTRSIQTPDVHDIEEISYDQEEVQ